MARSVSLDPEHAWIPAVAGMTDGEVTAWQMASVPAPVTVLVGSQP